MIQSVKTKLIIFLAFFLLSCFGPVKELSYQIEDSMDDSDTFVDNPSALIELDYKFQLISQQIFDIDFESKRNLSPVKNDVYLFFSSFDGHVFLFDFLNQKILWDYMHSANITAGLNFDNKKIFFVDSDGYLCALNLSGSLEWKAFVGEVFARPVIKNNSVIIKTSTNKFVSLNLIDGSENWTYQLPLSSLTIRSWGELVVDKEVIFSGAPSGKVLALNLNDGSLIWESTYSQPKGNSEIERSNDTTSAPIYDDYALYVVSSNGNIAALSKISGEILWSRPLSSFTGLSIDNNNLYVTHKSGAIYALNKNNNNVIWRNADLLGRDISKTYVINDYVFVSDFEGYIHLLDKNSGIIISRVRLSDKKILEPIIIENNTLISVSLSGEIFKIQIADEKFDKNILNKKSNNSDNGISRNNNLDDTTEQKKNDRSLLDKIIFWD